MGDSGCLPWSERPLGEVSLASCAAVITVHLDAGVQEGEQNFQVARSGCFKKRRKRRKWIH